MAIAVALVLGLVVLVSVIFVKELFILVGVGLVGFALYELSSALRFAGRDVPRLPLLVGGTAVVPIAYFFGGQGLWLGVCATAVVVALWRAVELAVRPQTRTGFRAFVADIAAGVFCLAYVVVLGSFAVLLLSMPNGQWWLLAFLIVTVVVDTGALVSGVLLGRAQAGAPDQSWQDLGGLHRSLHPRARRRCAHRAVHDLTAVVVRTHLRRPHRDRLHGRRSHGVADQARPEDQGHLDDSSGARRLSRSPRLSPAFCGGRTGPVPVDLLDRLRMRGLMVLE